MIDKQFKVPYFFLSEWMNDNNGALTWYRGTVVRLLWKLFNSLFEKFEFDKRP